MWAFDVRSTARAGADAAYDAKLAAFSALQEEDWWVGDEVNMPTAET